MPSKQLTRMTSSFNFWKTWPRSAVGGWLGGGYPVLSGVTRSTCLMTPCCPYLDGVFQSEDQGSFCHLGLSSCFCDPCHGWAALS